MHSCVSVVCSPLPSSKLSRRAYFLLDRERRSSRKLSDRHRLPPFLRCSAFASKMTSFPVLFANLSIELHAGSETKLSDIRTRKVKFGVGSAHYSPVMLKGLVSLSSSTGNHSCSRCESSTSSSSAADVTCESDVTNVAQLAAVPPKRRTEGARARVRRRSFCDLHNTWLRLSKIFSWNWKC